MNKSILILLVVSTLLLVDGQVTINNRMANSLLRDIDLECPLFGARPGASVTRGQVMRAFTFSDVNRDNRLNEREFDLFEEAIDALEDCVEID